MLEPVRIEDTLRLQTFLTTASKSPFDLPVIASKWQWKSRFERRRLAVVLKARKEEWLGRAYPWSETE
jgi:hypothetical protein